jgi:hypothetical protein
VTPLYPQKLALTSPTGGGRSVGIVRSRTKAMEFSLVCIQQYFDNYFSVCSVKLISRMYLFIVDWFKPARFSQYNGYTADCTTGKLGSVLGRSRYFSPQLFGLPRVLSSWQRWLFHLGVKWSDHGWYRWPRTVPSLRMHGLVPPFTHASPWLGA